MIDWVLLAYSDQLYHKKYNLSAYNKAASAYKFLSEMNLND